MMSKLRNLTAHIVGFFIPNKYRAHHVRHIIRYGIMRKIRESRELQSHEFKPGKYKYNLAIVAIMKNEGAYLQEWIEFHKLIGVEKFYLYDNESDDDTRKTLEPYIKSGVVDYTFFPGQKMQLPAYKDCIARHKNETKWLAVIDLDEYIVPTHMNSILPILAEQKPNVAQLIIPWVIFGSNGHVDKPNGGVLENYTKRARHSWLYKAIINPRLVVSMGCHEHNVGGRTVSMPQSKVRIHHYHCKSWAEYKLKAARGDAWNGMDAGQQKYQRACFAEHDLNDVVDTTALRFVHKIARNINHK